MSKIIIDRHRAEETPAAAQKHSEIDPEVKESYFKVVPHESVTVWMLCVW